jgi:hypothetical protein
MFSSLGANKCYDVVLHMPTCANDPVQLLRAEICIQRILAIEQINSLRCFNFRFKQADPKEAIELSQLDGVACITHVMIWSLGVFLSVGSFS